MVDGISLVPPGSWDCHMHCFDNVRFPLRADRSYTPQPASLESFVSWSPCDNIGIVQATIESSAEGTLAHTMEGRQRFPNKYFYATVLSDCENGNSILNASMEQVDELHRNGVRCIRMHIGFGETGPDYHVLFYHLSQLAKSKGITERGWAISIQMPLRYWAALAEHLVEGDPIGKVDLIADHIGCAGPGDVSTQHFQAFIDLVRRHRVYVKISALHRRSQNTMEDMKGVVQCLANDAPDHLLWGSDWPHVNSGVRGMVPMPPLCNVDALQELMMIKTWLSPDQWGKMLVGNPSRLFGPAGVQMEHFASTT
jgi:predicted TIM-barrel fold metal-dependent hydrolase